MLGLLRESPISQILGTGYANFQSPTGIDGLAKIDGTRLDVLAVSARHPGTGEFRDFILCCKRAYLEIFVWEDWNPFIGNALSRYGFTRTTETIKGERLEGWVWSSPSEAEK